MHLKNVLGLGLLFFAAFCTGQELRADVTGQIRLLLMNSAEKIFTVCHPASSYKSHDIDFVSSSGDQSVVDLVILYNGFGIPLNNDRMSLRVTFVGVQATSMSLNSDSAVKKPQLPELARCVDIINQSGAAAQPPVQPHARAVRRSPETRGRDFANVYWKREYTLFDLVTDEPIFPVIKEGREVYQIYYSSNEDPRPNYGEFSPEDLEKLLRYKFKTKESCMQFCNSRTKK